jgi:hypothetical protein
LASVIVRAIGCPESLVKVVFVEINIWKNVPHTYLEEVCWYVWEKLRWSETMAYELAG